MRISNLTSKKKTLLSEAGFTMPTVLSFIIAMGIITATVMMIVVGNLVSSGEIIRRQQALSIAEGGINYYLWHMAHNGVDFKDGNSTPTTPDPKLGYGPYEHDYYDTKARKIGTYTLWVRPNGSGSTVMTVRSIGKTDDNITRTIEARIGAASFASYGLLADVEFWFGQFEAADGPVFSNQGVHMDGPNSDTVGSANSDYIPLDRFGGDGAMKSGVWCSATVLAPNCLTRDKSNWLYPRPSVDFNQVTGALCTMKKVAFANDNATAAFATRSDACNLAPASRSSAYIPRYSSNSFSNRKGYLIQLNPNGTYDLYKVSNEDDTLGDYNMALTKTIVQLGVPVPSSGVVFVEDNVWVRSNSTFAGRLTVAAGRLGNDTNSANVNIIGDIKYTTKNGQDAIGLIAEKDVVIAPYAIPQSGDFTFEIDAATLAQSGSVTYPRYYKTNASRCTKGWVGPGQKFVYYGSVATRQYWTWNYTYDYSCPDNARDVSASKFISGVKNTTTSYDYNLYYAPPPSYPITGGYDILNWREVVNRP